MNLIQHYYLFGILQRLVPPKQFVLGKICSIQKVFVNYCFIRWNNENGDLQKGKTFSPSGLDKEIPSMAYTVVAILFRSQERARRVYRNQKEKHK